MKINRNLFRMNRNLIICLLASAAVSAVVAQALAGYESHINTSVTVALGYMAFFGTFGILFYRDNRSRYRQMGRRTVRQELLKIISSLGIGEIFYLAVRWFSLYYFLEIDVVPFAASMLSEAAAAAVYLVVVSTILKAARTY